MRSIKACPHHLQQGSVNYLIAVQSHSPIFNLLQRAKLIRGLVFSSDVCIFPPSKPDSSTPRHPGRLPYPVRSPSPELRSYPLLRTTLMAYGSVPSHPQPPAESRYTGPRASDADWFLQPQDLIELDHPLAEQPPKTPCALVRSLDFGKLNPSVPQSMILLLCERRSCYSVHFKVRMPFPYILHRKSDLLRIS